jgi:hypothetical protein
VNCAELKSALVDTALEVATRLLDQVRNSAQESNTRVCEVGRCRLTPG